MDFGSTVCIFRVKERCLVYTVLDNNSRFFQAQREPLMTSQIAKSSFVIIWARDNDLSSNVDTISRRLRRHKIQWSNWELILEHYFSTRATTNRQCDMVCYGDKKHGQIHFEQITNLEFSVFNLVDNERKSKIPPKVLYHS